MEQDKQQTGSANAPNNGKRSTGWIVAGGVAVLALAGIGAAGAMGGADSMGRHMVQIGMKHGGPFAGRGLGSALDAVDATAEQEDRIWAIIDGARAELRPVMREFRDTRSAVMDLIAAPTIDRAAAEKLRAGRIAAIDEASKKMTAAALEAAEVLTPEQRARLVENMKERKGFGRW
ncbi:Spy/CpxP family protein refolding chaperone [Aquamicrobium defluvii]|uniref:Membrane protein n=1 Tax=Aquamicrobium defluvii TaxID=69279 RepID=A0A011ULJ2_9HYPH|nr:periplasmic heavy metal sensor [Aquamicrobium defluvii]EXL06773.1 membrane protein [Aquamicrobium defluvii]EZQ15790.1 membrane protein [Halopseudomonas bauzanensis]TDR35918.1 Spy/CpxP family protein refolding chaperone [Aquamicrobium defluvii]